MLKCANCGSLVQGQNGICGLCGGSNLVTSESGRPTANIQQVHPRTQSRGRTILALTIGIAVVAEGAILIFLPINEVLSLVGMFMILVGVVVLMTITGIFAGVPYRSLMLNRAERDLRKRRQRKYAD